MFELSIYSKTAYHTHTHTRTHTHTHTYIYICVCVCVCVCVCKRNLVKPTYYTQCSERIKQFSVKENKDIL